nr:hypothetical protein BaRGS_032091 [Batillaria attramentaria]
MGSEVEREISFRTETGLYYSYYKQLVHAPSFFQGVHELMNDRLTEWPDSMNVLERMNIYQEVILAAIYRILPIQEEPIMFYIKAIFALHGMLIAALFATTWLLSHSWVAGVLTAAFYSINRADTTRVAYTIPLRESFSLPFLWLQIAALTYYFKPHAVGWPKRTSVAVMCVSTFLFCLFWQFNQFVMLLQALSLFGVWILDMLPTTKIRTVLVTQAVSLLAVCMLQFYNKMILGSLAISFILAALVIMTVRGSGQTGGHWFTSAVKVVAYSLLTIAVMILFNMVIKVDICRHSAVFVLLAALISLKWTDLYKEIFEELREFWDPDTVELMEWIMYLTMQKRSLG